MRSAFKDWAGGDQSSKIGVGGDQGSRIELGVIRVRRFTQQSFFLFLPFPYCITVFREAGKPNTRHKAK